MLPPTPAAAEVIVIAVFVPLAGRHGLKVLVKSLVPLATATIVCRYDKEFVRPERTAVPVANAVASAVMVNPQT